MDRALFIDSSSARESLHRLEIISNNLANVGTIGFRGDHVVYKSIPVDGDDKQSRVYSTIDKTYSSFEPGPVTTTGRDLDVAISGNGFIAVQNKSGQEGYTRAGNLYVKNGFLMTASGDLVKGPNGVINIPEQSLRVVIGADGSVLAQQPGAIDLEPVGQVKLTNPLIAQLQKGTDGLFYLNNGDVAKYDENVKLVPGAIEGSNVNAVNSLTELIDLSRQFEFHSNLMSNFSNNASKINQLLSLT